jgi:hypothetical protein
MTAILVVVAAKSEEGISSLMKEVKEMGGQIAGAVCDVSDYKQVHALGQLAIRSGDKILFTH